MSHCVRAIDSITLQLTLYACNSLYTSLQLTLHVAATHSRYGCNWAIAFTLHHPHVDDSILLQLTFYPCNSLYTSLQLTQHTAATELLPPHSVLDITCSMYMQRTIWLRLPLYPCNSLYMSLQLTLYTAATNSRYGCNKFITWLQLSYCLYFMVHIRRSVCLQLTLYPCNSLYTYPCNSTSLQLTHYISLQLTLDMSALHSIYGCNWVQLGATGCNWMFAATPSST